MFDTKEKLEETYKQAQMIAEKFNGYSGAVMIPSPYENYKNDGKIVFPCNGDELIIEFKSYSAASIIKQYYHKDIYYEGVQMFACEFDDWHNADIFIQYDAASTSLLRFTSRYDYDTKNVLKQYRNRNTGKEAVMAYRYCPWDKVYYMDLRNIYGIADNFKIDSFLTKVWKQKKEYDIMKKNRKGR